MSWKGVIEQYRSYLPLKKDDPVVTCLEGGTPLVPAHHLSALTDCEVYLKCEGFNPTGSFKDRGMTVAVSRAIADGAKAVICASTGNTAASAAAYSARAGITCAVVLPEGAIARGKLSQSRMHGAQIFAIPENFHAALKMVLEITKKYPIKLVNSLNPYRI